MKGYRGERCVDVSKARVAMLFEVCLRVVCVEKNANLAVATLNLFLTKRGWKMVLDSVTILMKHQMISGQP